MTKIARDFAPRRFEEDAPRSLVGKVVDVAVGAYVGTLLKLDKLNIALEANKKGSTSDRLKYAAYAPIYQTIVGGLSGAAVGVLQTIEQGAASQTVAQLKGSALGAAAGFIHGVNEAKDTLG